MNPQELRDTARALVAGDKGLLAMDESNPTCNKRFASAGIPHTMVTRRAYREVIVTTPGLAECTSGVILYDEMGNGIPSRGCIEANAQALARYAALCQEAELFGEKSARMLAIQYGGSVKPDNAAAMLGGHGVDGALIGGASLNADQFLTIVRAGIRAPQPEGASA